MLRILICSVLVLAGCDSSSNADSNPDAAATCPASSASCEQDNQCGDNRDWTTDDCSHAECCAWYVNDCGGLTSRISAGVDPSTTYLIYYGGFGGQPGGLLINQSSGSPQWPASSSFMAAPRSACHVEALSRITGQRVPIDCTGQWRGTNPNPNTGEGTGGYFDNWSASNRPYCNWDMLGM
jgi:hypothetical protein